ncbi:hypothetical protein BKA66DRAFT_145744 [Pyrenochaeta sp. MPI-SDFR-AT-0127]|nr:hypothetical protein BKA66DRAFT_145744 [Pyrenochaeta sp. MPI-SDFR-AT-0127]
MDFGREVDYMGTLCPTPPLPPKNPNRKFSHYEKPLPPLPNEIFQIEADLIPMPLFSRRMTLPPQVIQVAAMDLPSTTSSPAMSSSTITSPATSIRSSNTSTSSSQTSTPATSAPNSPSSRTRSLTYASPPSTWIVALTAPEPMPTQSLRRKKSPRKETLRSLRARGSDACLQRVYDQRLSDYLDESMSMGRNRGSGLRMLMEV